MRVLARTRCAAPRRSKALSLVRTRPNRATRPSPRAAPRSYFSKLRDVEVLLQTYNGPDPATVAEVMRILYATDDDFVAVDAANAGGAADA